MTPALRYTLGILLPLSLVTACSQSDSGGNTTGSETTPQTQSVQAPAGTYAVDHNHATLAFSIRHLGLSDYIARFTDYTATLELEPDDLSASSIRVSIDATSITTDYTGDYQATHPDSPFSSWEEDLAQSDKFFNAGTYPEITFASTAVETRADGGLAITGDLTLLGTTRPVTLDAAIVGATASHPMTNTGAIGFSARGSFKRSDFGMDYLLSPPLLGDEVTLHFDGEFLRSDNAADSGDSPVY